MVSARQSSNVGGNGNGGSGIEQCSTKIARHTNLQSSIEPSRETSDSKTGGNKVLNLLDLPVKILETIFGYLSFKNVADLRLVCCKVDRVCCSILNITFQRLQIQMLNRFQNIKSKMPRRESARRTHPLASESGIIETVHMRLAVLETIFGKRIERRHCCFFAGEILDEVYRVLNNIKVTPVPLADRYMVTDELFELSTMAMEYFKEHIEPTLPEITYLKTEFLDFTSFSSSGSSSGKNYTLDSLSFKSYDTRASEDTVDSSSESNMLLRKRIRKIKQGMKRCNSQLSLMRRDLRNCKNLMADQQKKILEHASRFDETDKKNEETSRKFSTLLQELNKCRTELRYWRSWSPAYPLVCTCGKVFAPAPSKDLQALANQRVGSESPNVDLEAEGALAAGSCNALPVASTSGEQHGEPEQSDGAPQETRSDLVWNLDVYQGDTRTDCHVLTPTNEKELPPLSPQPCSSTKSCGSKRKTEEETDICHESKKTRRSKRSKV